MANKCMKGVITCVYGTSSIIKFAKTPLQKIIEIDYVTEPHWTNSSKFTTGVINHGY